MSFAAVLTLIAGYEMLRPALGMMGQGGQWWRRPAFLLAGVALTSLLAGSAALPFAAYHFGNATLYYLPANMIAVPLTAFWVMPWGLAALALMPLGLGWLALAPMGLGIRALLWIAHGVAGWPGATLAMPYMPPWSLLLIAFGLVWGGLWRGWWRGLGVLPIGVGLVALLLLRPPDVLVGPQARLIALFRAGQVFAESAPGVTAFELQGPARVWGIAAAAPLDGAAGFLCTAQSCRTALRGRIVVVVRGEAERPGCQGDLVLATASLPPGCAGVVYDHARALAQGAADIWLGAGDISVVTDRDVRGSRPWVIGAAPVLPMARTE
jgi:competence protein ComEC